MSSANLEYSDPVYLEFSLGHKDVFNIRSN